MAYIGQSLTEGTRRAYTFVATSGQTTFNAVYGVGAVDVYQNGILLQPSDYNSSSGSSVVLGVGAAVNDEITIIAHNTFSVADTVSSSQGGTFAGNVSMSGTLGVTGAVTVDANITTGNTSVVTGGRFVSSQTSNDPWLKGVNSSNTETSFIKKDGQIYSAFGISLGGTGASNTLNDYEEGTWTPAPSSGSFSYASVWYIKIGHMVHCGANNWNFSDRTSNNHVQVSVPFQSATGVTATGSMIGRFINTGTQSTWSPYLGAGESSIYFYRNPADAGYTTLKHSDLNNSQADMHWHITYKSV